MAEINQITTHDLWVESRQFQLTISRPTPTTVQLNFKRPASLTVVDGAIVLLAEKALKSDDYPSDGRKYNPSSLFGDPAADSSGSTQIVAFWSAFSGIPFPAGTLVGSNIEWSITVDGTDPNKSYFASVHGVTNVLQYYPIGIQSYPLESSRIEKDSSNFTGSIPSLSEAPTNPGPGFVYYDKSLNSVQYWDSIRSIWIPTRADSIVSGAFNPGIPGHVYVVAGTSWMNVFDGKKWIRADSTNMLINVQSSWLPLGTFSTGTKTPDTASNGDFHYSFTTARLSFWDGIEWQTPTPNNTLVNNGSTPFPAFTAPFSIEPVELITPYPGLLFYNTTKKILFAYNGQSWAQANTAEQGTPITDKTGIGNDGSYDERLRLIRILKSQLGWPVQCVELTEEHFNIAIDNALDTYRQLAAGAYERRFILFSTIKDQPVYYLNSPTDQTDKIVSINKIHRLNVMGANTFGWENNVYYQSFLSQFYSSGYADILSLHLMHSLGEEFQRIFAGDLPFIWNEARRELQILRRISNMEKVILEVDLERTEQELLLDRWCKQWLQGWALAEAKETLGFIRSKYTSGTPGPNGTITLNGDSLLTESRQDFTDLRQQILDYEVSNWEYGNLAFLMG